MTTKKSKNYDLKNKTNLKHKPKETAKKKNLTTNKTINTFYPITNETNPKKPTNHKKS
jgi:hypothetical protein